MVNTPDITESKPSLALATPRLRQADSTNRRLISPIFSPSGIIVPQAIA
ncbi:hypothetical protein [Nostoc sp. DSM 114161]